MMNRRTVIPEEIYQDEVVLFLADRYHTTPRKVMQHFLEQNSHALEAEPAPFQLEKTRWLFCGICSPESFITINDYGQKRLFENGIDDRFSGCR